MKILGHTNMFWIGSLGPIGEIKFQSLIFGIKVDVGIKEILYVQDPHSYTCKILQVIKQMVYGEGTTEESDGIESKWRKRCKNVLHVR